MWIQYLDWGAQRRWGQNPKIGITFPIHWPTNQNNHAFITHDTSTLRLYTALFKKQRIWQSDWKLSLRSHNSRFYISRLISMSNRGYVSPMKNRRRLTQTNSHSSSYDGPPLIETHSTVVETHSTLSGKTGIIRVLSSGMQCPVLHQDSRAHAVTSQKTEHVVTATARISKPECWH